MISSFGELTANDLLNWAKMQTIGGSFFVNPNVTTTGLPDIPDKYFVGTLEIGQEADCKITLTNNSLETFINKSLIESGEAEPSWIGWREIATATPPEGYNLSLSDGISVQEGLSAVYSKDQFGRVVVYGNLVGQMQNGSVIATLPAGFRPIFTLEMPATCDFTAGRIQVNSAGEIRVTSQLSECSSLYFLAVFVAGG